MIFEDFISQKKGLTQNPKVLMQILLNSFPNLMNVKGHIAITSPAGVSVESLRTFRGKRLHLVVGPSWQGSKMLGSVNVKAEACV